MFKSFLQIILHHKFISLVCLAAVAGSGYWYYHNSKNNSSQVSYKTAVASKGTITVSVSGTGQVSASNQVDIKTKAAGDVVSVLAAAGAEVKAGTLLGQLDASAAQKNIRDAEAGLVSARLSLEKLKQPADKLSLLQSENSLLQARESKQQTLNDLTKAYDDGFNTVANAFLNLPGIMAGLYDSLLGSSLSGGGQWNKNFYVDAVKTYDDRVVQYGDDAYAAYQKAHTAYDQNFSHYKAASRDSDTSVTTALINETYETAKIVAEAVKSASNLVQFYKDKLTERSLRVNSQANTYLDNLNTYTGQTATSLSNLLSIKTTIQTNQQNIISAERTIEEKIESLVKLKSGTDPLDIKSQELSVEQKQHALSDAREKLADYFMRAPFDGAIAAVSLKKGDSVSSGLAAFTLVARQRLAEISLNEVDVAKIKVGQKATLKFDALPDLSLTGEVVEIDSLGTVSQGVVSYNIKVSFDTQTDSIKPSMSVSASIITAAKQDVLLAPNAAVKFQNGSGYYVEILTNGQPKSQPVQIGLANDSNTEIVSGVKQGDEVVTQIINASSTAAPATNNSLIPGGGTFRVIR